MERAAALGGYAARLHKQFPTRPPYQGLEATDIAARIEELSALTGVMILTSSSVEEVSGEPGRFSVKIGHPQGVAEVTVGAVVLATGWRPAGPEKYARYGLGNYPNVVTSADLEAMAAAGQIRRPSDQRPAGRGEGERRIRQAGGGGGGGRGGILTWASRTTD